MADDPTTDPQGQPDPAPERPDWLPEKFKSPEDMARSYKELEKKLGQRPDPVSIERADQTAAAPENLNGALEQAGLTFDDIEASVTRNGKPTEKQYEALRKVGMTRDAVDEVVRAKTIMRQAVARSATEAAGGREQLDALREWAASPESGVTDAEIEAFNAAVGRSGTPEQAESQVKYLLWRYSQAGGGDNEPSIVGGQPGAGGVTGFGSYEEVGQASMSVWEGRMTEDEFQRKLKATPARFRSQAGGNR